MHDFQGELNQLPEPQAGVHSRTHFGNRRTKPGRADAAGLSRSGLTWRVGPLAAHDALLLLGALHCANGAKENRRQRIVRHCLARHPYNVNKVLRAVHRTPHDIRVRTVMDMRGAIAVIFAYSICHTFYGCEGMCRACPIAQTAITSGAYKILPHVFMIA